MSEEVKAPISLQAVVEKHKELLKNVNLSDVAKIPRASRLNPRFLILAYIINGELSHEQDLPPDFLKDSYEGLTVEEWFENLMTPSEQRNRYRSMIELISYIEMIRYQDQDIPDRIRVDENDEDLEKYMQEEDSEEEEDEESDDEFDL